MIIKESHHISPAESEFSHCAESQQGGLLVRGWGRGRWGWCGGKERNSGYLAGLSEALSAGAMWRVVWNRRRTKEKSQLCTNKDFRQGSLQSTASMQLKLCHSQNSPPTKGAADAGSTWHTWPREAWQVHRVTDEFLIPFLHCSEEWWQRWYCKGCYELSSGLSGANDLLQNLVRTTWNGSWRYSLEWRH